ncbi:hypothetical protein BDK51DRAFT_44872 [Blyttiomyces helicus]|uniref:Uncharacterized protein n=1 Tax=Blyttiomyces helicus TaxID=388810 RepID=A0A4P9WF39_9FUNG|nr:hypothetical protein BDK51DRAFT_44872 [Blyttiomyces helicus]|eukprot:RKO90435.1 hypothetical protein BDK51DRAFT_44872 [Blyttiomyces helicus]
METGGNSRSALAARLGVARPNDIGPFRAIVIVLGSCLDLVWSEEVLGRMAVAVEKVLRRSVGAKIGGAQVSPPDLRPATAIASASPTASSPTCLRRKTPPHTHTHTDAYYAPKAGRGRDGISITVLSNVPQRAPADLGLQIHNRACQNSRGFAHLGAIKVDEVSEVLSSRSTTGERLVSDLSKGACTRQVGAETEDEVAVCNRAASLGGWQLSASHLRIAFKSFAPKSLTRRDAAAVCFIFRLPSTNFSSRPRGCGGDYGWASPLGNRDRRSGWLANPHHNPVLKSWNMNILLAAAAGAVLLHSVLVLVPVASADGTQAS